MHKRICLLTCLLISPLVSSATPDPCHQECWQQFEYCMQLCPATPIEDYRLCKSTCGAELYDCNADCSESFKIR